MHTRSGSILGTFASAFVLLLVTAAGCATPSVEDRPVVVELPAALEADRQSYRDDIAAAIARVREFFGASGFELPPGPFIDTAVVFESVETARASLALEFGIPAAEIPGTFAGTVVDRKLFLVSREAYRGIWRGTYPGWPWTDGEYRRLVTHELAHRAHESVAIARLDSAGAMGPSWFFEGLALVCAGQFDTAGAPMSPMKMEEIAREAGAGGPAGAAYPRYARIVRSLDARFGMKALITRAAEPGFPGSLDHPPVNEPVRVLEERDVEYAYPRWSADGKRILYQSNVSGRWQLYVMNEDGSGIRQVTADSSNNNFPDWSPDNARIAFVSDRAGDEEVYVMDSDGRNVRRLTFDRGRDIHPYWTPDGSAILFNSTRDDSAAFDIYEMKPDGGEVNRVLKSPDDETCARLSPGLDRMVYLKNNASGLDDLFMMEMKDRTETNLTNTPTTDGWPCWMPGGKQVVFSAIEEGRYKLFVYDLAAKSLKKLTDPPVNYDDGRANVSSDGKKIVFNRQINGRKNTIGIYVLRLD